MCKRKQKQKNKIEVFGQVHVHAWTSLRACNQAYVCRQDYSYIGSCPETLETS